MPLPRPNRVNRPYSCERPVLHFNPIYAWGRNQAPLRFFLNNSKTPGNIEKKLSDFLTKINVRRHFDVTMTKRQNTHISETEKVYCIIMTSFFDQKHLKFCTRTCYMIVFSHTKFSLVRIKRSGVKRGRGGFRPPA